MHNSRNDSEHSSIRGVGEASIEVTSFIFLSLTQDCSKLFYFRQKPSFMTILLSTPFNVHVRQFVDCCFLQFACFLSAAVWAKFIGCTSAAFRQMDCLAMSMRPKRPCQVSGSSAGVSKKFLTSLSVLRSDIDFFCRSLSNTLSSVVATFFVSVHLVNFQIISWYCTAVTVSSKGLCSFTFPGGWLQLDQSRQQLPPHQFRRRLSFISGMSTVFSKR